MPCLAHATKWRDYVRCGHRVPDWRTRHLAAREQFVHRNLRNRKRRRARSANHNSVYSQTNCVEKGVCRIGSRRASRATARVALSLSRQTHLSAIGGRNFPVWYGRCDTSGIAGRLGGTHTRRNEMKQLAQIVGSFWRDEDGQDLARVRAARRADRARRGRRRDGGWRARGGHLQRDRGRDSAAGARNHQSATTQAVGAAIVQRPSACRRRGHMRLLHRLLRTEEGQDLLEYAMLASLIALVALGAVTVLGDHFNRFFWQAIGPSI